MTRPTLLVYFHANTLERTIDTAKAFWTGLLQAAGAPNVYVAPQGSDPLFDPVLRVFPPVFVVRPPEGPAAEWVTDQEWAVST